MRLCPHRIGEEVEFSTADDPNAIWSGTSWTQITDGRVTLASSSSHALGSTGGAETHTLDESEMPQHRHNANGGKTPQLGSASSWNANYIHVQSSGYYTNSNDYRGQWQYTGYAGSTQPHNNMQPWRAVNRWQRVA